MNIVAVNLSAVTEADENGQLMRSIYPFDIEGRIGLGVPLLLCIFQHRSKIGPFISHAGQNIVAGTIEDAKDRPKTINAEVFLDGRQDWNAATDGGFEHDLHTFVGCRSKNLFAVFSHQRLVGGHDMLAVFDGFQDKRASRLIAPDQLDNDIDVRGRQHLVGIGGEHALFDLHPAIGDDIEVGNARKFHRSTEAISHQLGVLLKNLNDTRTDGAEPKQSYLNLFHSPPHCKRNIFYKLISHRLCPAQPVKHRPLSAGSTQSPYHRRQKSILLPIARPNQPRPRPALSDTMTLGETRPDDNHQ